MGNALDSFVAKVVDVGKSAGDAIGSGLNEVGRFMADVAKTDFKDALTTARIFGTPIMPGDVYSKIIGEGYKVLGWHDLEKATDPSKMSASQKAGATANTVINAASLVPGVGPGIKAAQQGIRGSKLMKAGSSLTSKGIKTKIGADISEHKIRNVFTKLAEDVAPKEVKDAGHNLIADQSLKYYNEAKKGIHNLADKSALRNLAVAQNKAKKGFADFKENIPLGLRHSLAKAWDDIAISRDTADFLSTAGKITLNKGIRTGIDAVKHGWKAGKRQFVTQVPNQLRKTGRSDGSEAASPRPAPLGNNGPVLPNKGNAGAKQIIGPSGTNPQLVAHLNEVTDRVQRAVRKKKKKKKRKQY